MSLVKALHASFQIVQIQGVTSSDKFLAIPRIKKSSTLVIEWGKSPITFNF